MRPFAQLVLLKQTSTSTFECRVAVLVGAGASTGSSAKLKLHTQNGAPKKRRPKKSNVTLLAPMHARRTREGGAAA